VSRARKYLLVLTAVLAVAASVLVIVGQWAGILVGVAGIVGAGAAVWPLIAAQPKALPPPEVRLPAWVIDRPAELAQVVGELTADQPGTVGITTALQGAGGFGKTTLAQMVIADQRVRKYFRGRIYLVTIGRDVRAASAIAAKVNDVIRLMAGEDAAFTDPELAGRRLGALLDLGPRRLLVLDDVWEPAQLAPFTDGGKRCARLVTTRIAELLAGQGSTIQVDQMSAEQSLRLLTYELPPLDKAAADDLLAVTGRWPLLLRLANKILASSANVGQDISAAAVALTARLRSVGPTAADDLLGTAGLDVGQPERRATAVRATIEASTSLLSSQDAARFAELAVFAADEVIPFGLVGRLWRATAGLDELEAPQLGHRLAGLALVTLPLTGTGTTGLALHDVLRDFLRAGLGPGPLARLNELLVGAAAAGLPAARPLGHPDGTASVAWWELGDGDGYLWDHLIEHLIATGRADEADRIATDLRWAGGRLVRSGPALVTADLALAGTARAGRLAATVDRSAHMLARTDPPGAVVDILHSRVADDPDWGGPAAAMRDLGHRPRLVNRWPLPDRPDPAFRRALSGHNTGVWAVAVAPDGTWLATGDSAGTVRIWDADTGAQRAVLPGGELAVWGLAVAPDQTWIACAGGDHAVRIWDVATWQGRAVLTGADWLHGLAVAPDGSWLASGDGTAVRLWDVATGQQKGILAGHTLAVNAVAVAPDGTWLATASYDGTVRLWESTTWQRKAVLTGHDDVVYSVAIAPDATWLATAGRDRTVRIWDTATAACRAVLAGHDDEVNSVAIAPDATWLATASDDGTVRLWDAVTGAQRAVLTGHHEQVKTVEIAPDGTWLVSGGRDESARIWSAVPIARPDAPDGRNADVRALAAGPGGAWLATGGNPRIRTWDAATGHQDAVFGGHDDGVSGLAIAPDGSWLATGGLYDPLVRIWDTATRAQRAELSGHEFGVLTVAVAADGTWLASADRDGKLRIWDVAGWSPRAVFTGHRSEINEVVIAPDGSWLATASADRTVRIWSPATGAQRTLTGHEGGPVYALAVAPDGTWLASGGADGTVRIWDVAAGTQRAVLTGHRGSVYAVAIAPDGAWVAGGGVDRAVRIWSAASGQAAAMMRVDSVVSACAWIGSGGFAIGGDAGLYAFDFLTGQRGSMPRLAR
jgi:WD40 repeat protein